MTKLEMFIKMCKMTVVSHDGIEYMPVWGYDGEICAYAPREEALQTLVEYEKVES